MDFAIGRPLGYAGPARRRKRRPSMSRRPSALATFLAVLALGPAAPAPSQAASLGRGTLEINPSFAHSSSRYYENGTLQFTTSTTNLSAFFGYSASDRLELGGSVIISRLSSDPGGGQVSVTSAGLTGGVTFNFP